MKYARYLMKELRNCICAFCIIQVGARLQSDQSDAAQKSKKEVKSGVASESDSRILLAKLDVASAEEAVSR
jgi:hypothetical protein